MKVLISINAAVALKAGHNRWGEHVVEVPAANLTEEQRAELGALTPGRSEQRKQAPFFVGGGTRVCPHDPTEPTAFEVIACLDSRIAARLAGEAKEAADLEEYIAKTRAVLAERITTYTRHSVGRGEWCEYRPNWPFSCVTDNRAAVAEITKSAEASEWVAELKRGNREVEEVAKAAQANERRADAAERETARASMLAWIGNHGSDRLKSCVAEEIECDAIYRDERLAVDRPGWQWYQSVEGVTEEPRNPSAEAFDVLTEARKHDPKACLMWYHVDWDKDDYCDDERSEYAHAGYVAAAEFLGRDIVFGAPQKEGDD